MNSLPPQTRIQRIRFRFLHGINRGSVLFTTGLLGVAHETLIQHAERPTLLILFAAMMGLPAFLSPNARSEDERKTRTALSPEEEAKTEESK